MRLGVFAGGHPEESESPRDGLADDSSCHRLLHVAGRSLFRRLGFGFLRGGRFRGFRGGSRAFWCLLRRLLYGRGRGLACLGDRRLGDSLSLALSLRLGHLDAKDVGEIRGGDRLLAARFARLGGRCSVDGARDQFQVIDLAQQEQQFGLLVEPGADAIHHRGDVLAHAGPVRARAVHLDFSRLREESSAPAA